MKAIEVTNKVKDMDELAGVLAGLRQQGKTIVHCHGVFDLIHPGHIRHFEAAKREGDVLVVTITQDGFVNKGPGRPVFNQRLRAESVAALQWVDFVAINRWPSAAIASHQAVDYWKNGGMRAVAFNDSSLLTCVGNDYGYPHVFEKPVEMFADSGDILIAISSSGRSENILRGSKAALSKGCGLITMSGFTVDNPLRSMGRLNFYAPSSFYGYVEITHLALCHCIVDSIIERRA